MQASVKTGGLVSPTMGGAWLRYQRSLDLLNLGLKDALDQLQTQYNLIERKGRVSVPEIQAYCDQLHVILERFDTGSCLAWEEFQRADPFRPGNRHACSQA